MPKTTRPADPTAAPSRPRRERSCRVCALRCSRYGTLVSPVQDRRSMFVAAAGLIGSSRCPLIALAALVVKLTSRGPAFYTQTRVGRDGQPFTIYKIRTMIHNCESLTGPRWSMPGDPRVTRVRPVPARQHLDELPQLLNVLRGEMSLIGPRPERPEFLPELERACRPTAAAGGAAGRDGPGPGAAAGRHRPGQRPPQAGLRPVLHPHISAPWLDLRLLVCTAVLRPRRLPFASLGRLLGIPRRRRRCERPCMRVLTGADARPRRASTSRASQ